MNYKNILRLLPILLFSLTCDETMLPKDCLEVEGGSATMDECGICDADPYNDNLTCEDCTGELNGIHIYDECGICDTYSNFGGIRPSYPYGVCDCLGILYGTAEFDCTYDEGDPETWDSACGGSAVDLGCGCSISAALDYCADTDSDGLGAGDTTSYCLADLPAENSFVLDCSDVEPDCATNDTDQCGICGGDNSSCMDCAGEISGLHTLDNCGDCQETFIDNCKADCTEDPNDCNGTWFEDECWGGDLLIDSCGVCGGDGSTCVEGCIDDLACNFNEGATFDNGSCTYSQPNYDCEGNCIAHNDLDGDGFIGEDWVNDYDDDGDAVDTDGDGYCDGQEIQFGSNPNDISDYPNETIKPFSDWVDEDGIVLDDETGLDCNDECGGSALIDCSGECRGGDTVLIPYSTCECFDAEALNFWCTHDYTIVAGSCGTTFSNYNCIDECDESGSYYNPCSNSNTVENDTQCEDNSLFFNSGCEYLGCMNENAVNYNPNAIIDNGTCNNYLKLLKNDDSYEITYASTQEIGGFQFNIDGVTINNASGGAAADAGFEIGTGPNGLLGTSFSGDTIPPGDVLSLLTILTLTINDPIPSTICITAIVISNGTGQNIPFEGNCITPE